MDMSSLAITSPTASAEIFTQPQRPLTIEEAVKLGAVDSTFYGHFFFPRTLRIKSPRFHADLWNELESIVHRYFAAMIFRDGAKTSLLRVYASKRIAYGMSRTILFIGKGEDHAKRSVEWLMNQVETNTKWTTAFGLRQGRKWSSTEAEIEHVVEGTHTRLLAMGITGQTRGVNVEDFRPDLIIVDDPCDLENTATPEQRQKMSELFFGAVYQSLAPSAESPHAKLALLQTPLARDDLVNTCIKDPLWHGVTFGCFDEAGKSRWPERKPTEELLAEKAGYTRRNQLSIWLREMECAVTSKETTAFDASWLQFYDRVPNGGVSILAVDPVPPPTAVQISKGMRGKDDEALCVVKRFREDYYITAAEDNVGHEPSWTVAKFYELVFKHNPLRAVVETVAYQGTLKWLLEQAAKTYKRFVIIEEYTDRRKKFDRIVDALSDVASEGRLHVHPSMAKFIGQFSDYPDVSHEDVLEAVALAVMKLKDLTGLAYRTEEQPYGGGAALLSKRPDFRAGIP